VQKLCRAAVTDVHEVRILAEVRAARLAGARHTPEDVTVLEAAAFVDADIALHAAVVAAARNPVLTDLFGEFVPALREGLIEMLDLVGIREHDPHRGTTPTRRWYGPSRTGTRTPRGRCSERSWRRPSPCCGGPSPERRTSRNRPACTTVDGHRQSSGVNPGRACPS
jgi:hypothetical protein